MNRRFALKGLMAAAGIAAISACTPMNSTPTIAEIASSNSDFSTLVAAASAAGLVDTLNSDGPLTVFAPTNEAFAALPDGTVETLLKPENKDKLAGILAYHVVPGNFPASTLVGKRGTLTSAQGGTLHTDGRNSGVKVEGANVTQADIMASNGVIHVIDKVLLPK
jgi:uncharacterized surface protein with fasciclin (FAS1) repeats